MEVISLSDSDAAGSSICRECPRSKESHVKMPKVSKKAQVERNEVITLSSNESVLEKESMRSSETERCRVKRKLEEPKIPFETPSPEKKVKQWMKNQHTFLVQKESNSSRNIPFSSQHLNTFTANAFKVCSMEESCRPMKSVLIRQDYVNFSDTNKTSSRTSSSTSTIVELNYKNTTNRYSLSESDSGCSTNNNSSKYNADDNKKRDMSELRDTSNHYNKNIMNESNALNTNGTQKKNYRSKSFKAKRKPIDQPMSPESQKKNELCSYLQLMNTNGTKSNNFLQNRRSIRVINHQKLLERRETEKMLKRDLTISPTEITDGKSKENTVSGKCSTKKSFAELNLDSFAPSWVQNTTDNENVKNASPSSKRVAPTRNISKENNFEDIMRDFLITENEKTLVNGLNSSTDTNETEETRKLLEALKKNNSPALNEKICDQLEQYLTEYVPLKNNIKRTCETKGKTRHSVRLVVHKNNSSKKSNPNNLVANKKKQLINSCKDRVDYKINRNRTLPKTVNNDCKDLTLNRSNSNKLCVEMTENNVPSINVPHLLKEKLKTQFELIKNLTPEHRKALFDSTKFSGVNQIRSVFVYPNNNNNNNKQILESNCDDWTCNGFELFEKDISEKESTTLTEILNELENHFPFTHNQRKSKLNKEKIETQNKTNILEKKVYHSIPAQRQVQNCSSSSKDDDISKQQSNESQISTNGSGSSAHLFNIKTSTMMTTPSLSNNVALLSNAQNLLVPISTVRSNSFEIVPTCSTIVASSSSKPLNSYLNRKRHSKIAIDSSLQTCDNNDDEEAITSNQVQSSLQAVQPVMLAKTKGLVEHAYYFDFTLVVVQELFVSFWKVCPLGNILGVDDMWEAKGDVHRLVSDHSTAKTVTETVVYMDKSVAYFEMWTKINDTGLLDVIVVIYFWLECFNKPCRKIVLLDSVKCKDADVTYTVLKRSRKIIVATCTTASGVPTTFLNNHHVASDYQSLACSKQMGCVNYFVRTLHNIQDCDTLIMGCGEQKITLWNVEYGFVVATIDLLGINENPQTLWTKCDRGFLFVLQQFSDNSLKLIAINGINYTWKLLRSFEPNNNCGSLQGVCVENGLLVAFFDKVTLCWKIENREEILELLCDSNLKVFVSDSNVISVSDNHLQVKNALQYLLTCDDILNTK